MLLPINWILETLKWYEFIDKKISFWEAIKATLAGVAISIFSPNRTGDYAGRVLLVKAEHNWASVIATMAGNYCQFLVLLTGGGLGLLYFGQTYLLQDWEHLKWVGYVVILFILFLWSVPFIFLRWETRLEKLEDKRWIGKFVKNLRMLRKLSLSAFLKALCFAVLRYVTFCSQYFLMLKFYGIEISALDAYSGIATIFLIQLSIPLPPVSALLARGQIALTIWSPFHANSLGILAATFTLFIINLVLPSFLGLLYIIKINTIKSLGYENLDP